MCTCVCLCICAHSHICDICLYALCAQVYVYMYVHMHCIYVCSYISVCVLKLKYVHIQNISCFSFDKASKGTVMFSRDIEAEDLIQMPDGASGESSGYVKHEQSVFVDKILQKSQGKMKIKLDFGDLQDDDLSNDDDVDTSFDFGKEFESNGTYLIEKAYCKKRDRRSAIFSDLSAPSITKATLLATIDTC